MAKDRQFVAHDVFGNCVAEYEPDILRYLWLVMNTVSIKETAQQQLNSGLGPDLLIDDDE